MQLERRTCTQLTVSRKRSRLCGTRSAHIPRSIADNLEPHTSSRSFRKISLFKHSKLKTRQMFSISKRTSVLAFCSRLLHALHLWCYDMHRPSGTRAPHTQWQSAVFQPCAQTAPFQICNYGCITESPSNCGDGLPRLGEDDLDQQDLDRPARQEDRSDRERVR